MVPDYTVVVGIDAKTLPYFLCNVRTWRHFHPGLFTRPWAILYDGDRVTGVDDLSAVRDALEGSNVSFFEWRGSLAGYQTQREKMLSGHVYVARRVRTEWFVKIDCDAIATEPVNWPRPEWFERDTKGREPVLVGPSWGYTRAKSGGGDLIAWCERMEQFGDTYFRTERANWVDLIGDWDHPKGPKMKQTRWVSWLGWQRADWVREMADLFERDCGPGKLPIPSHDSSLWLAAQRAGEYVVFGRQQKQGWTNRVQLSSCRNLVDEVLQDDSVITSN